MLSNNSQSAFLNAISGINMNCSNSTHHTHLGTTVWYCKTAGLEAADIEQCRHYLSGIEKEKAARLRGAQAIQYIVSRGLLRHVLNYLIPDVKPNAWQFSRPANGKPRVQNSPVNLDFNISHTHNFIAIAVSKRAIGIDVESLGLPRSYEAVVKRYYSDIEMHYVNSSAKQAHQRFTEIWTLKEALVKLQGLNLFYALKALHFNLEQHNSIDLQFKNPKTPLRYSCNMYQFLLEPAIIMSLAVEHQQESDVDDIQLFRVVPFKSITSTSTLKAIRSGYYCREASIEP